MCRNIHTLFNFEPAATEEEVRDASLQYVRKISGFTKPSQANEQAFARAVEEVSAATRRLLDELVTTAAANDCAQPTLISIAPTSRTASAISRPISRIASVSRAVDALSLSVWSRVS